MSLLKKVEETKTALKILAYGGTGTGKTKFALSFPNIVAIDSEIGMTHYKKNNKNLKYIAETTSASDVEEVLDEVLDANDIETFVIDSETKIYENMQHSGLAIAEKRAKQKGQSVDDSNLSQREWGKIKLINKKIQSTKIMLSSKGVNVVSIAQEKDIKEKKGDNWITVGYAPDTAKGFEYDYDLVLRFFTEEKDGDVKYFAKVVKDRTEKFKKGDIIENCNFSHWKDIYDNSLSKKEDIVDFRKDINKDEKEMDDNENIETIISEFKESVKLVKPENKSKMTDKIKELNIDLKDLKKSSFETIEKLVIYIKTL